MSKIESLNERAVTLLKGLIAIPSFSKQEDDTATLLARFLLENQIEFERKHNNFWALTKPYHANKPTIWLNSHHDTVKPNSGYTKDPYAPIVEDGKLFGLGSNDAGGCLVSLIATFLYFKDQDLPFNLVLIISAEEEISGAQGISSLIDLLPKADLAIVGEPTQMQLAVAEKGLMVIDAKVKGIAGHAARNEGINAIYQALQDLTILKNFKFRKKSEFLGESKVSATVIHAGTQHNVVPDLCEFTLDLRITDAYTLEEAFRELSSNLSANLIPRSMRLQPSRLPQNHPILSVAAELQLKTFGSPTLSDQALIPYPSVKIGPGDSARSHSADEFIYLEEIKAGISGYISILEAYSKHFTSPSNV